MKNILYIVVPCYNEEEVLRETTARLAIKLNDLINKKIISNKSKILYVNDGSNDMTWEIIKEISRNSSHFTGISLSKNKGHQNALVAGLLTAKKFADVVISMDADLQDDIDTIDKMLDEYLHNKCEIVYGVRTSRKKDTFFKKNTAQIFYKFMKGMGVDIIYNHADYRLTSKRVLNHFESYKEVNLFLRGIFPLMGFKNSTVYYERNKRFAGSTKYPLKKMLSFALEGITSFTIKPLRMICAIGILILIVSIVMMLYSFIRHINGYTVPGWTFLSISIWLIGGIQMISTGIIGEYVGKVYIETKQRPRYIIEESLLEDTK